MVRDVWMRLPALARALVPGLAVSAVGLVLFGQILDEVLEKDAFSSIDAPMIEWLSQHRSPWLTDVMTFITNVFGPVVLPILVAVGCGWWGWRTRSWRDPLLLTGAMVLSTVLAAIVKVLVERPRPDESLQVIPGFETSYSFPSGHATGASTLVLVTAYLLWRRGRGWRALAWWAGASVVVIGLVATTRMYLGYHFLSDVLAGACLGLFTLGLVMCADRWLDLRDRSRGRSEAVSSP